MKVNKKDKAAALKMMETHDVAEVAKKHDVTKATILKWKKELAVVIESPAMEYTLDRSEDNIIRVTTEGFTRAIVHLGDDPKVNWCVYGSVKKREALALIKGVMDALGEN